MKKLILFAGLLFMFGVVNAQWTDNGNVLYTFDQIGIGTNSPATVVDVQNSGYTGFFIKETSGTGAAQFRFRANVSSFNFDNPAGSLQAKVEFNGGSNQVNFVNNVNGNFLFTSNNQNLYFTNQGRLGIGTLTPQRTLSVNGSMESEEVEVKQDVADYVFSPEYFIMPLENLESYIQENGHLPRIQTQEDVDNNNGLVKVGELSVSLMEKVEELTLHMIELNKRVKSLEKENKDLKKEILKQTKK
jgi:hypothetical protein